MAHFVKVFDSIIHSTIWQESATTKVVWITLLAMADSKGEVQASIPGLAKAAGVTLAECEAALNTFLSPDPYSRSKEAEGRRIEVIEGGWELINYKKYRDLKSADQERENAAIRQRRHRERMRQDNNASHGMSREVTKNNGIVEVEEEVEEKKNSTPLPPKGERKKRQKGVVDLNLDIADDIKAAVNDVLTSTPYEDKNGRIIRVVKMELLERMQRIYSEHKVINEEKQLLPMAWKRYLASNPYAIKAPQYFFGKQEDQGATGANWVPWVKEILRERKQQNATT